MPGLMSCYAGFYSSSLLSSSLCWVFDPIGQGAVDKLSMAYLPQGVLGAMDAFLQPWIRSAAQIHLKFNAFPAYGGLSLTHVAAKSVCVSIAQNSWEKRPRKAIGTTVLKLGSMATTDYSVLE